MILSLTILLILLVVAWLIHRYVHCGAVGMTPLAGYIGAWTFMVVAYEFDPLGLNRMSIGSILLVGIAFGTFMLGYGLVLYYTMRSTMRVKDGLSGGWASPPNSTHLRRLWVACCLIGGALFCIYIYELAKTFGFSHKTLGELRSALGNGSVPAGFYYFIFFEPVAPLSVILALVSHRHRWLYLCTAVLAGLALVATSGRTNATFAALWAFCAFAIYQGPRIARIRFALVPLTLGAVAFVLFQALGDSVGKTYQNSYLYGRFGNHPPIPRSLVNPYLYLEGPLPAFSALVANTHSFSLGRFTFRPVFQVLAVLDHHVAIPAHIQRFELIPMPFNLSTYLWAFYTDFGPLGVVLGPLLLGLLLGGLYARWQSRPSPASLCVAAFATTVAIASIFDLPLLDLSRVLELGAVLLVTALDRPGIVNPVADKVTSRDSENAL